MAFIKIPKHRKTFNKTFLFWGLAQAFFFFFLISSSLEFIEGFHLLLQIHCHDEDIRRPAVAQEIL